MFWKCFQYILLSVAMFFISHLASPIASTSERGSPSIDRARETVPYHLTDEEIQAHQSAMKANRHALLQHSRGIHKRSAETLSACYHHNTFKDSPYGRVPDILYKYYSATCQHPHRSGNFTITCEAIKVLADGQELAIELINFPTSCPVGHYCYSLDADENDVGVYKPKSIEDIGCAKAEPPRKLQAILVKTSGFTPVKASTGPINPLDKQYEDLTRWPPVKRPVNRKFLLQAEVCALETGKSTPAKEIYVERSSPTQETLAKSRDWYVASAEVMVLDDGKNSFHSTFEAFQLGILAAINHAVAFHIVYFVVIELARAPARLAIP